MFAGVLSATAQTAPAAPAADPASSYAPGVVALPPYTLDAVIPPWARDTRTAVTTEFQPWPGSAISLVDSLRTLAGVHIDQPGGPGGRSSIYLRGGEENYTVVLLDGVPVNNSTDSRGGGFDFGTLDADNFFSVEVVRGPVSARYGPDALAGVIKLTSDVLGAGAVSRAGAEAGSDGQALGYALVRTQQKALTTGASVHWSEAGSRADGNYARHESAAAGATWQGANLEWRASVRYGRYTSAAFPDDSGGRDLAVLRSLEERSGSRTTAETELLSPSGRDDGVKWRVRAWGAWLRGRDDSPGVAPGLRDPAGLPASREATLLRRAGFSAEGAVEAGDRGTLAFGVDGESEQGRSDAVLIYGPYPYPASFSSTRDRIGTFAEYTWRPERGWLVQPSVRVDKARDYQPRLTPRLGVKVPLGAGTTLRINAGTGFKLPSFYAVSNPLVGNPSLKPEKSRTIDAAIERTLAGGRLVAELGAFSSRYRDSIDFDPGPPPRLVNRNEIRSDGLEVTLRARPTATLAVAATGTYDHVRVEPGGARPRGRPRTQGSLRASWNPRPDLTIDATAIATGTVLDSSVPTGDVVLPGWWRMDVSGRYRLRDGLSVTVTVENLLDTHYEEAIGVPSPGLRWRAGLALRF